MTFISPMSSKPSQKMTAFWQAQNNQTLNWSKRLWSAVEKDPATYKESHKDLFKEFEKLHDAAKGRDSTNVTVLNHITPIYNHITSQGYQSHIHFMPLKEAMSNYCKRKPVVDWKCPSVQLVSWSTSLLWNSCH